MASILCLDSLLHSTRPAGKGAVLIKQSRRPFLYRFHRQSLLLAELANTNSSLDGTELANTVGSVSSHASTTSSTLSSSAPHHNAMTPSKSSNSHVTPLTNLGSPSYSVASCPISSLDGTKLANTVGSASSHASTTSSIFSSSAPTTAPWRPPRAQAAMSPRSRTPDRRPTRSPLSRSQPVQTYQPSQQVKKENVKPELASIWRLSRHRRTRPEVPLRERKRTELEQYLTDIVKLASSALGLLLRTPRKGDGGWNWDTAFKNSHPCFFEPRSKRRRRVLLPSVPVLPDQAAVPRRGLAAPSCRLCVVGRVAGARTSVPKSLGLLLLLPRGGAIESYMSRFLDLD
ncbi:hypothetical protein MAPG_10761 [Magnaporthiopsis poae ATCC 64411]|uniref:Uncharacterized protein n=1 Tax=Magnaporthiopsis poae (strain ATCC 64411 / 73-15) TaxID=644358 RepID=A0A0C4EDG2_MAGP6|nr:hypothetical protein MAPG_10761 [Magnaporthiopsis poae ATCC 64411]